MASLDPDLDPLSALRRTYARQILLRAGALGNHPLETAFATVRREAFLGPGPWRFVWRGRYHDCPAEPDLAYQDALFALREEKRINNGEPSLHAMWMHAVQPRAGEHALIVGAGAGYYGAILAELVGPTGSVQAIEYDPQLAATAKANLTPWQQVQVEAGDGTLWPREPVDLIYVCASCERPAPAWLDNLRPGGRLIFPLGTAAPKPDPTGARLADLGVALMVTRETTGFAARVLAPAYFIMAEGTAVTAADDERERLRAALRRGGLDFTNALRWQRPPSPQALYVGAGWSLEPRPPEREKG